MTAYNPETDKMLTLELELRNIYYNPATGYQSAEKLYQAVKEKGITTTRKDVKNWLHSQQTYTTHFPKTAVKHFQRTYVKNLADQLQMDLVDLSKYGHLNLDQNGHQLKWILTGIEILSRFAFAIPVCTKKKEAMAPAISTMLDEFKSHFKKFPDRIQFDSGTEFYNSKVKTLLRDNNIDYFSTHRFRKAAIVERFNRTLKTRMWKYFSREKQNGNDVGRWSPVLGKFISSYNNTVNRSIKMKPNEVSYANAEKVHLTLFGIPPSSRSIPKPKFSVGDSVRIPVVNLSRHEIPDKGFSVSFTDEVFQVSAVYKGLPTMYRVKVGSNRVPTEGKLRKDGQVDKRQKKIQSPGEDLLGKFYERELVRVVK